MPQTYKGERVAICARVKPELSTLLRREAKRRHIPVGDLVAAVMAERFGREDLSPIATDDTQKAEPMLI